MTSSARLYLRTLGVLIAGISFIVAASTNLSAQDAPTVWDEILQHAPAASTGSDPAKDEPGVVTQRIHSESSTDDILASLTSPEASLAAWDLAIQRLKTERRTDELVTLLDQCIDNQEILEVRQICVFHRANQLAREGEFATASTMLETALAYQSLGDNLGIMALNLAELSAATGNFERARALYNRLADVHQQVLPMHLGLAMLALKQGDLQEARAHMQSIVAQADAESTLLGSDTFYVPDGDEHLVRLLFSMVAGDGDGAQVALSEWSDTPSAQASVNQEIWRRRATLPDSIGARVQSIPLPTDCYPTFVDSYARERRMLAACTDQKLYEFEISDDSAVAENVRIITDFSEVHSSIVDVEQLGSNRLRVLFETGIVHEFSRNGEEWSLDRAVSLDSSDTVALQLIGDDSALLLHSYGNSFSVVPIEDGVGAGTLLSIGNGRAIPTLEFGSSGTIGVSSDSNQVLVFEVESRSILRAMNLSTPYELHRIALSPNEQTLAVQTEGRVSLYSLTAYRLIDVWRTAGTSGVGSLRWSSDGRALFATTNSATYRLLVDE